MQFAPQVSRKMPLDGIENLWKKMICCGDCFDWIGAFEENKLLGLSGRREDEGWMGNEWMDSWNEGGREGGRGGEWSDVSLGDGCYKTVRLTHPSSATTCVSMWPLRLLGGPTCSNIDVATKRYLVSWLFHCVCLTAGTNSLSWCLPVLLVNKPFLLCVHEAICASVPSDLTNPLLRWGHAHVPTFLRFFFPNLGPMFPHFHREHFLNA